MKSPTTITIGNRGNDNRGVYNRRGGMLIIVLIVLAVSVILISSAMMVTLAARNRYYVSAERDQAYLTALSAAKTINAAIYYGQISDTDIAQLAANTATASLTGDAAPGMDGSASASTTATFSQQSLGMMPDGYIFVDVATKIDASVDTDGSQATIRLVLKQNPPVDPGFQSLLTVQPGNNSMMNFGDLFIGDNAPAGALNLVVIKNKVQAGSGTKAFISDLVFTNRVDPSNGIVYENNIVFFGNNGSTSYNGGGDGLRTDGYIIAVGGSEPAVKPLTAAGLPAGSSYANPLSASVFTNASGSMTLFGQGGSYNGAFQAKGLYVSNSFFGTAAGWYGNNVLGFTNGIYVDDYGMLSYQNGSQTMPVGKGTNAITYTTGSSTTSASAAFITDIKNEAQKYKDEASVINRNLSDAKTTAYNAIVNAGLFTTEAQIEAAMNNGILPKLNPYLATGGNLSGSAYVIDLRTGAANVNATITFDLTNNEIVIYLLGDKTLNFNQNGGFKFVNGTSYFGRMISYGKADISISPEYHDGNIASITSSPTGIYATTGTFQKITSTPDMENISGSYGYKVVAPGFTQTSVMANQANAHLYSYNVTRSGSGAESPIPHFYCYMFGDSQISTNTGSVLQGYYGLYDQNSKLACTGYPLFYARFEVCDFTTASGQVNVPYCPAPNSGGNGDDGSASKYKFFGYETL